MCIEQKVMELLSELSGLESIDDGASLHDDLALDSLAMVTLLIEIEETFGIVLDESDMNPFDLDSVQSVIELVRGYCEKDYEETN